MKLRHTVLDSAYFSSSNDAKVVDSDNHLIISFEIERNRNSYISVSFLVVDLYGLECDIKTEINSNNKRMYDPSRILIQEKIL